MIYIRVSKNNSINSNELTQQRHHVNKSLDNPICFADEGAMPDTAYGGCQVYFDKFCKVRLFPWCAFALLLISSHMMGLDASQKLTYISSPSIESHPSPCCREFLPKRQILRTRLAFWYWTHSPAASVHHGKVKKCRKLRQLAKDYLTRPHH